jgi:hypothetical protein
MGTFAKDNRPDNGLEHIAEELVKDELSPRLVVGIVVPHAYGTRKVGEPIMPVVRFAAIEVVDGSDALTVRELIDKYRGARHQGPADESLFDSEGWAREHTDDK